MSQFVCGFFSSSTPFIIVALSLPLARDPLLRPGCCQRTWKRLHFRNKIRVEMEMSAVTLWPNNLNANERLAHVN